MQVHTRQNRAHLATIPRHCGHAHAGPTGAHTDGQQACMHTHMHTHACTSHTCTHTLAHTHAHTLANTHVHIRLHTHACHMHDRAYLDGPPRLVEHVVQAVGENAGLSQPRGHSTSGVLGVPPAGIWFGSNTQQFQLPASNSETPNTRHSKTTTAKLNTYTNNPKRTHTNVQSSTHTSQTPYTTQHNTAVRHRHE
jgi:hypothetical protein